MSEFDDFETAEQPQTEEDPAAAFLAREQDQLAGLEDDDGFGPTAGAETTPAQQDEPRDPSPPQPERIRIEPEKIRLWREEQQKILEEKDEQSEKVRGEWAEIAKKELDDWYRHRNEQLEKTKVSNRALIDSEKDFVSERDEQNPGHEWERICRLCEFNPKVARSQKDISRMRSILLQLKQTPLTRA